ncbi:MAG: hypothetical protein IH596_03375 [Bacteroidales bacterium]|nr:hypothetical protein [Bacteroidales bacterium]
MKTIQSFFIMLITVGVLAVSCTKSEDPAPAPTPKYPQLMGTWQGFTSQNDTVIFIVTNTGATLNLKRYKYGILYQATGIYDKVDADFDNQTIPFATDNMFAYNNGLSMHDSIIGTFNVADLSLTGTISREFTSRPGSPIVRVTYTATKK